MKRGMRDLSFDKESVLVNLVRGVLLSCFWKSYPFLFFHSPSRDQKQSLQIVFGHAIVIYAYIMETLIKSSYSVKSISLNKWRHFQVSSHKGPSSSLMDEFNLE